jgi:hypothetical protein
MSRPLKKISSLESLILEKQQLRTYCTYQEKLIKYKFEELKRDFPEIISNKILPFDAGKNRNISSLLDFVNEFVQRILPERIRNNRLAGIVLKLVEVIVIRGFSYKSPVKSSAKSKKS